MKIDFIANLRNIKSQSKLNFLREQRPPALEAGETAPSFSQLMPDGVSVSDKARNDYKNDPGASKPNREFEHSFKDALIEFTQYALNLNGFENARDGSYAVKALHVLAEKSGIRLDGGPLSQNQGEILADFKAEWNLSNDASAEEILATMKRVFGEDGSFAFHESPPGIDMPENIVAGTDGTPEINPSLPPEFRDALVQMTNRLFEKHGFQHDPDEIQYQRVLNNMAEKLGIHANQGSLSNRVFSALGLEQNSSVSDMVSAMSQLFKA
jgi:hypothetical protein